MCGTKRPKNRLNTILFLDMSERLCRSFRLYATFRVTASFYLVVRYVGMLFTLKIIKKKVKIIGLSKPAKIPPSICLLHRKDDH